MSARRRGSRRRTARRSTAANNEARSRASAQGPASKTTARASADMATTPRILQIGPVQRAVELLFEVGDRRDVIERPGQRGSRPPRVRLRESQCFWRSFNLIGMVGGTGLEPVTPAV